MKRGVLYVAFLLYINQYLEQKVLAFEEFSFLWKTFTFAELNLLSDDLLLKGITPKYDFYVPMLPQLHHATVRLKLRVSPYLRDDSTLTVFVDDIPRETYRVKELPPEVKVQIFKINNRSFAKISIVGNLRVSNNICEDVFSEKVYFLVEKESQVEFVYRRYRNVREFLIDYDNQYCISDPELIPFVYQFCKQNPIPCEVRYGGDGCKRIRLQPNGVLELRDDTLYVPALASTAFERGVFLPYLLGETQQIKKAQREGEEASREASLRDLGIQTVSVEGVGNLSYTIPLDTSRIGGIPDKLYFRLFIVHTPIHKKNDAELRIHLDGKMISAYPLEGSGRKSFDIELPVGELKSGVNYVSVNLVNFGSAENCFGTVPHVALTIFENSYFYWNSLRNDPATVSDFLRILHGRVALLVKDHNFYPQALRIVNYLSLYNKNIKSIDLEPGDVSKYDFILLFEAPQATRGNIVDLSRGDFDLVNPLTGDIIFSSKPRGPFSVIMVQRVQGRPTLIFSYYPGPSGIEALSLYRFSDLLGLFGNTAVATKEFVSSYEVGKKLKVEHKYEKNIRYYWNRYRIWIVTILLIPITIFLAYVYKRLTKRIST